MLYSLVVLCRIASPLLRLCATDKFALSCLPSCRGAFHRGDAQAEVLAGQL